MLATWENTNRRVLRLVGVRSSAAKAEFGYVVEELREDALGNETWVTTEINWSHDDDPVVDYLEGLVDNAAALERMSRHYEDLKRQHAELQGKVEELKA